MRVPQFSKGPRLRPLYAIVMAWRFNYDGPYPSSTGKAAMSEDVSSGRSVEAGQGWTWIAEVARELGIRRNRLQIYGVSPINSRKRISA